MLRNTLLIIIVSVFALSNLVVADSQESKNGKPFSEIWEAINTHEERIGDMETKLSAIEDNPAKYTVDFQRCLNFDNSEAAIPYSNGPNMSETLIWNCADYEVYGDQHIELFFTSDDGQCFKMNRLYVSEGDCESPYIPPENPVFKANITDFELTTYVEEDCKPFGLPICDYYYSVGLTYTIENTGNTTLFNMNGRKDFGYGVHKDSIPVLSVGSSVTKTDAASAGWNISEPRTYTVTVGVEMWDGAILDSQTKTITVVP